MSVSPPGKGQPLPSYGQSSEPNIQELANTLRDTMQDFCEKTNTVMKNPSLLDNPAFLESYANAVKNLIVPSQQAESIVG